MNVILKTRRECWKTAAFVRFSDLEFDSDDHRGEIFVQLLQHDQLLQRQVEQPGQKQRESASTKAEDATVQRTHEPQTQDSATQLDSFVLPISCSLNWDKQA